MGVPESNEIHRPRRCNEQVVDEILRNLAVQLKPPWACRMILRRQAEVRNRPHVAHAFLAHPAR